MRKSQLVIKLRNIVGAAALLATLLIAGCRSTEPTESGEMTSMMSEQMQALRAQMQAQGATAQQLREFDRATAQMNKSMRQMERQMERQMKAMEAAN